MGLSMATLTYITACTFGADHEELLREAVTDRLRYNEVHRGRELRMRGAAVMCLKCRAEIPLELDERVK